MAGGLAIWKAVCAILEGGLDQIVGTFANFSKQDSSLQVPLVPHHSNTPYILITHQIRFIITADNRENIAQPIMTTSYDTKHIFQSVVVDWSWKLGRRVSNSEQFKLTHRRQEPGLIICSFRMKNVRIN